jgi:hypothetical protein
MEPRRHSVPKMVEIRFINISKAKSARAAVASPVENICRPDISSGLDGHKMKGNDARIRMGMSLISHLKSGDRIGWIGLNSFSSVDLELKALIFFSMAFHPPKQRACEGRVRIGNHTLFYLAIKKSQEIIPGIFLSSERFIQPI